MITILRMYHWYVCRLNDVHIMIVREQAIHKDRLFKAAIVSIDVSRN